MLQTGSKSEGTHEFYRSCVDMKPQSEPGTSEGVSLGRMSLDKLDIVEGKHLYEFEYSLPR